MGFGGVRMGDGMNVRLFAVEQAVLNKTCLVDREF